MKIPSSIQVEKRLQKIIEDTADKVSLVQSKEQTISDEYQIIHPAQDFINGKAFVTVPLQIIKERKIKKEFYLITSSRERYLLEEEETLANVGLYTEHLPRPKPRWSKAACNAFLQGSTSVDIKAVFSRITNVFNDFVDFGDARIARYFALWVIGTYFHRMFEAYPYIHLNGHKESGKTKTLQLVALTAFNAELSVGSTPAYMIRMINDNSATCCVDEAENLNKTKDEETKTVIGMYNTGYKKGSTVGKMEQNKGKKWTTIELEAYSPKVFAGIKGLDPTLASRCMPITMVKSSNVAIKNKEVAISHAQWQEIKDELYLVMMDEHNAVRISYAFMHDDEVQGREWELWKPILAIANIIAPDLFQEMRQLALEVQNSKKEAEIEDTNTPKLLEALKALLQKDQISEDFYSTGDLLECLRDYDEEHFGWIAGKNPGRWLGDELRKAGVVKGHAKQKKIGSTNTKGFTISLVIVEERLKSFNSS